MLEALLIHAAAQPLLATTTTLLFLSTTLLTYRLLIHPLSHIPGPFICKITSLWLHYHAYIGTEASTIHALHAKYGPIVRIAPNKIDISDAEAVPSIYISHGGFEKAPCYSNFNIDDYATIFSTTDSTYRTPRAKAVMNMFSTASLKANLDALYECVERMVQRMEKEKKEAKCVNVLNLGRSLAVDVVSTHLFAKTYHATEEKSERLSVSPFVDAFVAVGRFFYLPHRVFEWVEWGIGKFAESENTYSSMEIVEKFVDKLVRETEEASETYPGKLLDHGIETEEVKAQCKDLIFAGTDSTGMNFATMFRGLAMNQEWLGRVRREVEDNEKTAEKKDIQSLPLLSATIREALRVSMANPTRLPRIVPAAGWKYKDSYLPPGTEVGCSAYSLHFNSSVFPDPHAYKPERWLTNDTQTREAMNAHSFAFGAGQRVCIARNLAQLELFIAAEKVVLSRVLEGARAGDDVVEIFEWFNSSVKKEKIEVVW